MKDINKYINEASGSYPGEEAIEIWQKGKYGFMYYDPNSGLISTYCMNRPQDLVDEFGYEEEDAEKMAKMKVGQSLTDVSSAIYTRIW